MCLEGPTEFACGDHGLYGALALDACQTFINQGGMSDPSMVCPFHVLLPPNSSQRVRILRKCEICETYGHYEELRTAINIERGKPAPDNLPILEAQAAAARREIQDLVLYVQREKEQMRCFYGERYRRASNVIRLWVCRAQGRAFRTSSSSITDQVGFIMNYFDTTFAETDESGVVAALVVMRELWGKNEEVKPDGLSDRVWVRRWQFLRPLLESYAT